MHDRFEFKLRMVGPEWIKFRNAEITRDTEHPYDLHVPSGWDEENIEVVMMADMDVQTIHYSGPLTQESLSLLELLISYTAEAEATR